MSTFVINIIHRPEMVPEYAEKVTGHGQTENIGRKALLTEIWTFSSSSNSAPMKTA